MILNAVSTLYSTAAGWRRAWYAAEPSRRRRLQRPVVSVGNLRAGGAGKTPVVIEIARLLEASGEQPAILLRGYARTAASDGVTIVSDGSRISGDLAHAGDEALMLARALPSVPVLVADDRHLAGCLAERRLGATVHVLDDGFQHLRLMRDVDLLVVDGDDLSEKLLPAGRLREPVDSATNADALITADERAAVRWRDRVEAPVFRMTRRLGPARLISNATNDQQPTTNDQQPRGPVFVMTGIARPQRFLDDLAAAGWTVSGSLLFRDHHQFTAADIARVNEAAKASGAALVVTTEKDAVRLERFAGALALAAIPLQTAIESAFGHWLVERLGHCRTSTQGVSA